MFILKKIISVFLYPLPLSLLLSFLGLYFLWFTNRQKAGKILVSVGLIILTLFSYSIITNRFLRPLERKYDTFEIKSSSAVPETEDESMIKFVVVLGGGHTSDPELPPISQIGKDSLVRLIEGIRVYRKYPGAKLLLSGGAVFDPISEAEIMARVAREIGVPERDIILESKSQDTRDEALFIKPIVGNEPFVLVTTASHIPRSMALFKKLGMNPIPSPIGHSVKDRQGLSYYSFFPGTGSIRNAELAIHEYLGMTWAKLRGQM
ncbi:MAG: envelope biogenesis factor ElyC [Candidatus Scalindua sp.]|nr:envelope biogenesis factor ElyC [Candidatus Scalindua sp.]